MKGYALNRPLLQAAPKPTEVGDLTKHEISEVRLALIRIETGHYGECTACGLPISNERLVVSYTLCYINPAPAIVLSADAFFRTG